MKSRGKELKIIFDYYLSDLVTFPFICATSVRQAALLTQTVTWTVNAVRWTYFQYLNFTSIQNLFFLFLSGAFMQFAVILLECFKCHTCFLCFHKSGLDGKHTLLKEKCFPLVHLES